MLPASLHPVGRYLPHLLVKIDFTPSRTYRFAGPCSGQDRELKRSRPNSSFALAKGRHKSRELGEWQRRMMNCFLGSAARRERVRDKPMPSGGIIAGPVAPNGAQSSTASIRPRTRLAVSVLVFQISSMHFSTRPVSMSATERRPIVGKA